MDGNLLNREEIALLIAGNPPLIEDYVALELQIQPNGFDLTVREAGRFTTSGQLGASDEARMVSGVESLAYNADDWLFLEPGAYLVTFNEIVNLPPDLAALGRPRSSLLRSGVALHTGVWDVGYRGRSQSLLTVHHPIGFRLQRNARLAQLVFFRLAAPPEEGYQGRYQGEGLQAG